MKATTKDLRLRTAELLAAVDRGEEVVISYRGHPRARLVPVAEPPTAVQRRTAAFGMWSDRGADVDAWVRRLRQPRPHD